MNRLTYSCHQQQAHKCDNSATTKNSGAEFTFLPALRKKESNERWIRFPSQVEKGSAKCQNGIGEM